ncbi:MAG TPA: hypothetical protein VHA13_03210, partial [Gammaproteobacteria bacterium]|nr:hypothetical protein [Gammaproteobacteria bacterium]
MSIIDEIQANITNIEAFINQRKLLDAGYTISIMLDYPLQEPLPTELSNYLFIQLASWIPLLEPTNIGHLYQQAYQFACQNQTIPWQINFLRESIKWQLAQEDSHDFNSLFKNTNHLYQLCKPEEEQDWQLLLKLETLYHFTCLSRLYEDQLHHAKQVNLDETEKVYERIDNLAKRLAKTGDYIRAKQLYYLVRNSLKEPKKAKDFDKRKLLTAIKEIDHASLNDHHNFFKPTKPITIELRENLSSIRQITNQQFTFRNQQAHLNSGLLDFIAKIFK